MPNLLPSNKQTKYSDYEKALLRYFAACIASELSKILIFSLLFYQWNMLKELGAALLFLFIFRSCSGGLHCKNYISCLCLSFFILLFSILLGQTVFLPKYLTLSLTLALGICSYRLSPVLSANRPPATPAIIRHAKIRTSIAAGLLFLLLCFCSDHPYGNIGFWMFGINTLQLFTAYMIRGCQHVTTDQDVNLVS